MAKFNVNPLDNYATPKKAVGKEAEPAKKRGRPKTRDVKGTCKKVCIALPNELVEKWEEVKIVHGSNMTDYIVKLMEKDMKENYNKYIKIIDTINKL